MIPGTVTVTVMQENHEHSFAEENLEWYWADDYSSAILSIRCDTCTYTELLEATITSTITEATETEDGSIVYTAAVSYEGITFTDSQTVIISATGTSTESSSGSNADNTDSNETNSSNINSADADSSSSAPQTGDANLPLFLLLAILGCIVTSAAAKEKIHR